MGVEHPEHALDQIHIRDLQLRCILGVHPQERREKQDILINITLYADLAEPCATDQFETTVDYRAVKKRIIELVENSSWHLVEKLAQQIADACLEQPKVRQVKVIVDKPGALRFARSAAVEIARKKV